MKFKKKFEPKTTNISPRRIRTIMVAIFMQGWWRHRVQIPTPKLWKRIESDRNYDFSRNNSFRSAEVALFAKRLNVPFALMSFAARRNTPHAANASPEPTEMRRTPRSVNWESES